MASNQTKHSGPDPMIRPRNFFGLYIEDALIWLDHFKNVASYHQWTDERKVLESRTLFDHVAPTWFIQQPENIKADWLSLKALLIQTFAHKKFTQIASQ